MPDKIPLRVIQTGRTRPLHGMPRAAAANLRLLHPNWEFLFFNDEEVRRFVADVFPQYQSVFEAFPRPIQRYDFFRYLAVYHYGGFYFDLDVFLWQSLDPLLDQACVFPFEELTLNSCLREKYGMDWEIGNYAFGAAPGHPFMKAVIENCVRSQREPAWVNPMLQNIPALFRRDFYVLNTTGPGLLSRTLAENPEIAADVTVLFPVDVRDEQTWHHFGSYGIHIMDGSWRDKGNFLRRRLASLWEVRQRRKLMPQSIQSGPARSSATPRVPGTAGASPAVFDASPKTAG